MLVDTPSNFYKTASTSSLVVFACLLTRSNASVAYVKMASSTRLTLVVTSKQCSFVTCKKVVDEDIEALPNETSGKAAREETIGSPNIKSLMNASVPDRVNTNKGSSEWRTYHVSTSVEPTTRVRLSVLAHCGWPQRNGVAETGVHRMDRAESECYHS